VVKGRSSLELEVAHLQVLPVPLQEVVRLQVEQGSEGCHPKELLGLPLQGEGGEVPLEGSKLSLGLIGQIAKEAQGAERLSEQEGLVSCLLIGWEDR